MRTSKQEAIGSAKRKFSGLREIQPGRWTYYVWSDDQRAWLSPLRVESYREARRKRAASIASVAVHSLLCGDARDESAGQELTWRILELAYSPKTNGPVERRVNEILRRLA